MSSRGSLFAVGKELPPRPRSVLLILAFLVPLSALAVKQASLSEREDRRAPVFVYEAASESVRLRMVTVGNIRGNRLEIFDGLEAGERVVTAGVAFLHDGMSVRLWRATP